jgi:hypothetical protein
MSDASSPQRAPGIVWLLGALAGFAVVAMLLNGVLAGTRTDPRLAVRTSNRADIEKINNENLVKLGLVKGKSEDALGKGLAAVKAMSPTTSTVVVPGSPTQLKQAAAAPAPAATKPAEAAPAAPVPAPSK